MKQQRQTTNTMTRNSRRRRSKSSARIKACCRRLLAGRKGKFGGWCEGLRGEETAETAMAVARCKRDGAQSLTN